MLEGMLVGGLGGLAPTVAAVEQLGPIGAIVGAVVVGSGYLWSRWGLKRDATRYAARALFAPRNRYSPPDRSSSV